MKFKKRPVLVDAIRLEIGEKSQSEVQKFTKGLAQPATGGGMTITTLEGTLHVGIGDWIIKGVRGEVYPCKHDIFKKTYEPADSVPVDWESNL